VSEHADVFRSIYPAPPTPQRPSVLQSRQLSTHREPAAEPADL